MLRPRTGCGSSRSWQRTPQVERPPSLTDHPSGGVRTGVAGVVYEHVLCVAAGKKSSKRKEDTFGMNDDDWNVYRAIVSVVHVY